MWGITAGQLLSSIGFGFNAIRIIAGLDSQFDGYCVQIGIEKRSEPKLTGCFSGCWFCVSKSRQHFFRG